MASAGPNDARTQGEALGGAKREPEDAAARRPAAARRAGEIPGPPLWRVVLDPGVLVSALITPNGTAAKLLAEVRSGGLELIVSPLLLGELTEVLAREKFRRYVDPDTVSDYLALLHHQARNASDPPGPSPLSCADPDDEYLIVLAHSQDAALLSGDGHLLADRAPIFSPAAFLAAHRGTREGG
jgi:putative PIN family toxin of toxin-antitoxin system